MRNTLSRLSTRAQLSGVALFILFTEIASAAPRRVLEPDAPRNIWDLFERTLPWFRKILDVLNLPPG